VLLGDYDYIFCMQDEPCKDQFVETDLGPRALNKQNKNKTIVIPKVALENCGAKDADEMNVILVQSTNGDKFIKLVPKPNKEPDEEKE